MNIAVFSDVHANLEAFKAVLEDMDSRSISRMVCLGDIIGYGPNPEECARLVMERKIPTVLGNHEWALIKNSHKRWFNVSSRPTVDLTEALISEDVKRFCCALPVTIADHGALFVHGAPPNSVVRYLFQYQDTALAKIMERMEYPICFAGHTHDLGLYQLGPNKFEHRELPLGETKLPRNCKHIVNAGSVGQPRDDYDFRAKYLIWNTKNNAIKTIAVDYDLEAVKTKMKKLGFPDNYINRLGNR